MPAGAEQKGSFSGTPRLTRQGNTYIVTIPGVAWTMQFPAGDLEISISNTRPGWGYFALVDKSYARLLEATKSKSGLDEAVKSFSSKAKDMVLVSFWVDDAAKCNHDARIARDNRFAEMKAKVPVEKPRLAQIGQWYLLEFFMPQAEMTYYKGAHQFYAHAVRDGIWIDFHLTRIYSGEEDRQLFLNFLNSVRFVPAGR